MKYRVIQVKYDKEGLSILKKMIDATKQATKEPKPLEDLTMEERLERFNRIYLPPLKEMENYNNQKARSLS